MNLRYTKRAARQIDKVLDYVAARSPQGAARLRERLQAL
jgi:plasmid stabilization system protein ParE